MGLDLYQVDLLRERRAELGLPEPKPVNAQKLLYKGVAVGASVFGLAFLWLVGSLIQLWMVSNQAERLRPQHQKYLELEAKLQQLVDETSELEKSRKQIAGQILSLRSSSALLQALASVTPPGVQINQLTETPDALIIKGQAVDPYAFSRINYLVLTLSKCPLFRSDSVQLVKAQRQQQESSSPRSAAQPSASSVAPNTPGSSLPSSPPQGIAVQRDAGSNVNAGRPAQPAMANLIGSPSPALNLASAEFEVKAKFRVASDQELSKIFIAYGSRGKALRIKQLAQEGLMP